jgi:hypothetical protein
MNNFIVLHDSRTHAPVLVNVAQILRATELDHGPTRIIQADCPSGGLVEFSVDEGLDRVATLCRGAAQQPL